MNNIQILYLGSNDWENKINIPDYVEWIDENTDELPTGQVDLVLLDREIHYKEMASISKLTRAYCLFATENVSMISKYTQQYFEERSGQYIYTGDLETFLLQEAFKYYNPPYGEKFLSTSLTVSQFFGGSVSCNGSYDIMLEGDFGTDFSQVVYWKHTIPIFENQSLDLYFEHHRSGSVEIKLRIYKFYNGSVGDISKAWEFSQDELDSVITINNDDQYGPLFVSVLAKGKGSLDIISLHDRHSRYDIGYFLPGGDRLVSSDGEELFAYVDKGDCKPPFAIYFSGYRKQEGFEGYRMMRQLGCPFMLVTDPRLEGGAFYVDNSDLEDRLWAYINKKLNELGFKNSDLVLSGGSMGTYGSLYYATKLAPYALILAKPLTELGTVAENERINRPGVFPTSLDLLMKNYGSLSLEAARTFDERLWKQFDFADWSHTKFIISYLYEDDYDQDGYKNILMHLKSKGVEVYGKGTHGHHMENHGIVMAWFKSQYDILLEEDFNRKR